MIEKRFPLPITKQTVEDVKPFMLQAAAAGMKMLSHVEDTVELIKEFKERWQQRVEELGTQAILSAAAKDFNCRWYFNRTRLFGMADDKSVLFHKLNRFRSARLGGWIDSEGYPLRKNKRADYSMEGGRRRIDVRLSKSCPGRNARVHKRSKHQRRP